MATSVTNSNTTDVSEKRLFGITIHDCSEHTTTNSKNIVASAHNLDTFSFLYRRAARETIDAAALFVIDRTSTDLTDVCRCFRDSDKKFMIYAIKIEDRCICCVTGSQYDRNVCTSLINKLKVDISTGKDMQKVLDQYIEQYKNSDDMNKLLQIQKDLDVVKDTMISNIDTLLKQGETIDDLVKKSENMAKSSKTLLITARKFNRCPGCTIL